MHDNREALIRHSRRACISAGVLCTLAITLYAPAILADMPPCPHPAAVSKTAYHRGILRLCILESPTANSAPIQEQEIDYTLNCPAVIRKTDVTDIVEALIRDMPVRTSLTQDAPLEPSIITAPYHENRLTPVYVSTQTISSYSCAISTENGAAPRSGMATRITLRFRAYKAQWQQRLDERDARMARVKKIRELAQSCTRKDDTVAAFIAGRHYELQYACKQMADKETLDLIPNAVRSILSRDLFKIFHKHNLRLCLTETQPTECSSCTSPKTLTINFSFTTITKRKSCPTGTQQIF